MTLHLFHYEHGAIYLQVDTDKQKSLLVTLLFLVKWLFFQL